MKNGVIFLAFLGAVTSQSFGYYKFYENFGGSFYDYGEGLYHAYNGSSPGPDADDAVCTDRGVYLNGSNTYVTLHSSLWSPAPLLTLPFEINLWAMPLQDNRPLIYRGFSGSERFWLYTTLNKKLKIIFYVTSDSGATYTEQSISTDQDLFLTGNWYFIRITLEQTSSFRLSLHLNGNEEASYSDSSNTYFEIEAGTTYIGKAAQFLKGFVYLANIFRTGTFSFNTYYTTSCSYNQNSCSSCPYGQCLSDSQNTDENNQGIDCGNFGCSESCDTSGNCLDCSYDLWPICDVSLSIPNLCDPSCNGCAGPDTTYCMGCSDPLLGLSSTPGECECLTTDLYPCGLCASDCISCTDPTLCITCADSLAVPKADNSGACECSQGTYFDTSCQRNSYIVCHSDCLDCSDATSCNTCVDALAVPKTDNSGACECPQGTYFDTSCQCNSYIACHSDCLDCSDSTSCNTCVDALAVPKTDNSGACECPQGTYFDTSCQCNSYIVCHSDCLDCSDGTSCNTCVDALAVPKTDNSGACECPQGTYFDTSCQRNSYIVCHSDCSDCSDATSCNTCVDALAVPKTDNSGACECPQGTYTDTSCQCNSYIVCHSDCLDCSDGTSCNTCIDALAVPKTDNSGACECPQGTYFDTSCQCNSYIVCHSDCLDCSDGTSCNTCVDALAVPKTDNSGACECSQGTYFDTSCQRNSYIVCHSDCLDCSDGTSCNTCVDALAVPKTDNSGACECPQGTYFDTSCQCNSYTVCHSDCLDCSDATSCDTCVDALAVPKTDNSGACECPQGTYFDTSCQCNSYIVCHSDCLDCSDGTSCDTCVDALAIPKTDNSGACECPQGTYFDTSCQCNSYIVCHSDCSDCSDGSSCNTCVDALAVPKTDNSGACECPQGTYFDTSCQRNSYTVCHSDCLDCSDATSCDTCIDPLAIPKLDNSEGCECPQGTYFDVSCQCNFYTACHSDCLECSQGNFCTTCAINGAVPNSIDPGCSCPSNSYIENGTCVCLDGYYKTQGICEKCDSGCLECDETQCLRCELEYSFIDTDGNCQCPKNSKTNENDLKCECEEGYYLRDQECLECKTECSSCSEEDSCLSCKDTNAIIIQGDCECPENSSFEEGYCVCNQGYESSSSESLKCTKQSETKEEMTKMFSGINFMFLAIIAIILAICYLIIKDPLNLWSIFNTIQILSYVPLHNIDLPSQLRYVTNSFDIKNYIPNVIILFLGNDLTALKADKPHWKEYGETASFYQNIGEFVSTFTGALSILVIGGIFAVCIRSIRKRLSVFRYNTFIKMFLEMYLPLLYGSIIAFSHYVDYGVVETEPIIGSGVFVVCLLAPLMVALLLYKIRRQVLESDVETENRFDSLFKEFEVEEEFYTLMFYPFFLTKRLVYMVSLYYFYTFPRLQVMTILGLCLFEILLITICIKYRGTWRHRLEIFTQVILAIFFFLLGFFIDDIDDFTEDIIAYIMIGSVTILLFFDLLYFFVNFAIQCKRNISKSDQKENEERVVPISIMQSERVFALRRNRNSYIIAENNNKIDNIYFNY